MKRLLTVFFALCATIGYSFAQETIYEYSFKTGLGEWISVDGDKTPLNPEVVSMLKMRNILGLEEKSNTMGWGSIFMDTLAIESRVAVASSHFQKSATSDDWLISPEIEIKDGSIVLISAFNYDQDYADNLEVYATENGDKPSDFKKMLSHFVPSSGKISTYYAYLAEHGFANKKVRIAIKHKDKDKYVVGVSEVKVINIPVAKRKISLMPVAHNIPKYWNKNKQIDTVKVKYTIADFGYVNNFNVTLTLDIDTPFTKTYNFKDLNLGYEASVVVDLPVGKMLDTIGYRKITLSVDSINNVIDTIKAMKEAYDISFFVFDSSNTVKKMSLFEGFTSSTHAQCVQNDVFLDPMLNKHKGNVAFIKYATNIHSPADPFSNEEAIARQKYYGITKVPNAFINGYSQKYTQNFLTDSKVFSAAVNNPDYPAFVKIENPTYNIDTVKKTATITANLTTVVDSILSTNTKVRVALVDFNAKNTLDTTDTKEMKYICQHFIPNADGTPFTAYNINEPQKLELSFTLPESSQVSHLKNTGLVIFVQDDDTKYIMNAAWATTFIDTTAKDTTTNDTSSVSPLSSGCGIVAIYPNPSTDFVQLKYNVKGLHQVTAELIDTKGVIVRRYDFGTNEDGTYTRSVNVSELPIGSYILNLRVGGFSFPHAISIVR